MADTDRVVLDPLIHGAAEAIEARVASVLLGKNAQVRMATAALLAGQHLLLSDLPGMGKTTLASALARVVGGSFQRVQGTPDLLPTDLVGASIFSQANDCWTFHPGPLLSNVVLIDEVNRITPRTQSALLEAMAEGQVSIDGRTHRLPRPFMVVATMNPVGSAGTFTMTAGQLDRFGLTLALGPVERSVERRLLRGEGGPHAADSIEPVLPPELLPSLQAIVAQVTCSELVLDYVLDLCDLLRPVGHLSTRAALSVVAASRGLALLEGRHYVVPDDVRAVAVPCLAHRLAAEGESIDAHAPRVRSAVEELAVPDGRL